MDVITRSAAYQAGKVRFYTGTACKKGHLAQRYVSTGGCVQCAVPYKFRKNSFDKRAVPYVTQSVWVRNDYNEVERKALDAYMQQCIDTFDRATRPNDAPLMYMPPPPPQTLTATSAPPGTKVYPGLDTYPSAQRGPGRPRLDDRCEHGIDKGFCEICDE